MKNIDKYITAFKADTDGIRKKTYYALGAVVLSVAAGIVLTKMNSNKETVVFVIEEHSDLVTDAISGS